MDPQKLGHSTVAAEARPVAPASLQLRGAVVVRAWQYADSGNLYLGAGSNGRGGMYDVTVRVPGYQEWSTWPVIVWPAPLRSHTLCA